MTWSIPVLHMYKFKTSAFTLFKTYFSKHLPLESSTLIYLFDGKQICKIKYKDGVGMRRIGLLRIL